MGRSCSCAAVGLEAGEQMKKKTHPQCPKCGSPMVISGTKGDRSWLCKKNVPFGGCWGSVAIDDKVSFSAVEIARNIAEWAPFFQASKREKKVQTEYRRTASGLDVAMQTPCLSKSEIKILEKAAEIVSRLGYASERAKEILKDKEKERNTQAERNHQQRCRILISRVIGSMEPEEAIEECDLLCQYLETQCRIHCDLSREVKRLRGLTIEKNFGALYRILGETLASNIEDEPLPLQYNPDEWATLSGFARFKARQVKK